MKIGFLRYLNRKTQSKSLITCTSMCLITVPDFLHSISHSDVYSLFMSAQQQWWFTLSFTSRGRKVCSWSFLLPGSPPWFPRASTYASPVGIYRTFSTGQGWWEGSSSLPVIARMFEQFPEIYLLRRVLRCRSRWMKSRYVCGIGQRHPEPL